jgi:hypothetical protein
MSMATKPKTTNFLNSSDRKLSAEYKREGEDGIVWNFIYK